MSAYTGRPESALKPAPAAMRRWLAEAMAAAAAAMADSDGCGSDRPAAASAVGDSRSSTTLAPCGGAAAQRQPVFFGGLIVAPKISAAKLRTAAANAVLVVQAFTVACGMWCVAHCFSGNGLPKQNLITSSLPCFFR